MTAAPMTAPNRIDANPLAGFVVRRSGAEVTLRCTSCGQQVHRAFQIPVPDVITKAALHLSRCDGG